MSSKYECFNCLGKCGEYIEIFNPEGDNLCFCSKPCMKVTMRDKTSGHIGFIHSIANMSKYLKNPTKEEKFMMKVSQAINDHVSERMLILYFEKVLKTLKEDFGNGHLLVENGSLPEGKYIRFGDFIMVFNDTYEFLASIWSND